MSQLDSTLANMAPDTVIEGVIFVGKRISDGAPVLFISGDIVAAVLEQGNAITPHLLAVKASQIAIEVRDGAPYQAARQILLDYHAAKPKRTKTA